MTTLPALGIDPFSDDVLADPLEFHGRLRAAGAVVRLDQSEGFDIVGVGRDETVREIFDNPTIFLNSRGGGILDLVRDEPFREPGVLQETDPPYHDGARKVMAAIISPKNLRTMRERFQVEADALVDSLIDKGTFDAQIDMAQAYPLHVVPDSIMGARPEGRENLLRYSTWLFESMGSQDATGATGNR